MPTVTSLHGWKVSSREFRQSILRDISCLTSLLRMQNMINLTRNSMKNTQINCKEVTDASEQFHEITEKEHCYFQQAFSFHSESRDSLEHVSLHSDKS